jgi:MarR family transcriptional regulator, organic hydroperoxide resistance regulator
MAAKKLNRSSTRHSKQQKIVSVLRDFRIIFGSVRQHFREVERQCGVSGSQLWILQEIKRHPGIGVSDLADLLAIHQSTCSQLVEKLVGSRHVTKSRSRDDQRRVGLQLTGKGQSSLERAPGPTQGLLPEAISELSPSNLESLHRSLRGLISKLDINVENAADRPLADM